MRVFVTGTRGVPNIMGGVETHCEELYPRIAKRGVNVTILRRSNYVHDSLAEWNGIKLITLHSPKIKSFEAIVHTLRAIICAKNKQADIIHIHAIGPALLIPIAKMLRLKVVFTHHGPDYDREKWGYFAKVMLKLGERMGCTFADDVIVISNVIKDIVANKYGRLQRVHLIYNGVPTPIFCNNEEYFKELGIEKGKYIMAMCRFVPEKNLHHLIEAFAQIRKQYPTIKLVLVGDADFEDEYSLALKKRAKEVGVVMTGFIKGIKLQSILTHSRCFVLPSSHEGLPIALLEAMAYNLPVIVSDIPANIEIGLAEKYYFPCGDISALSNKIESVLKRPLERIHYDMIKYNRDRISEHVTRVYNSLMNTNS